MDDVWCLCSRAILLIANPELSVRVDPDYVVWKGHPGTWTQDHLFGLPGNHATAAQQSFSEQQCLIGSVVEGGLIVSHIVGVGSVRCDRPIIVGNVNPNVRWG
jgi:hypothetical protein